MDKRERGIADRERLVIVGISSLYVDTQDPTIQKFVQKSKETFTDTVIETGEQISTADIQSRMLDLIGHDPIKRKKVLVRALHHAKGILVGKKRSPDRDERLSVVTDRLSKLNPIPIK